MKLLIPLFVFVLSACNLSSNSTTKSFPPSSDPRQENTPQDYNRIVDLTVLRSNEVLTKDSQNLVEIKGTVANSNYLIRYNFNSAEATSLKLFSEPLIVATDCSANPQAQLVLIDKQTNIRTLLMANRTYRMATDTDYMIEFSMLKFPCANVSVTFNPLVWIGFQNRNPEISYQCWGSANIPFIAFALRSFEPKAWREDSREFVRFRLFCGESLSTEDVSSCTRQGRDDSPVLSWNCRSSGRLGLNRQMNLSLGLSDGTALLSCLVNNNLVFQDSYSSCQQVIKD